MFLIGEFSKLARVSRKQLYYYEEVGLLLPEKIDRETGYRYYSAAQLPRLNKILALKELGLTLDQVRRMLDDDISAEEIRGMLALRKAQIEQNLREEVMRMRYIESRIQQLDIEGMLRDYDVVLKQVEAQRVLTFRETIADLPAFVPPMAELLRTLPERVGTSRLHQPIILLPADEYQLTDIDAEIGFTVADDMTGPVTLASGRTLTPRTLPTVETMATAVRTGPTPLSSGCYHAIGTWMEVNGYQFAGVGREVFLQLDLNHLPDSMEDMVVEVQFPVERRVTDANVLLS